MINLANILTLTRVILTPMVIVCLLLWNEPWDWPHRLALLLFLTACVTDALDGWVARRSRAVTQAGKLLDPLADKFLLVSVYLVLSFSASLTESFSLPAWLAAVVILRDLILVGGALAIRFGGGQLEVTPNALGKSTTFLQMLLAVSALSGWGHPVKTILLFCVPFLTTLSGLAYIRKAMISLTETRGDSPASHG